VRATPETIWRVPAFLPYLQPPLTDAAVARAERQLGYQLPAEYLALLRAQNGGYIRFSLPDLPHDSIAGIGPHYPSLTGFDWDDCQEHVSFPLPGLVPFDGDGHWHLCLDYRKDPANPVITYADVECDRQSAVADSFADYLARLRIKSRDEYVLAGVADVEAVKAGLAAALGVTFDPPDTWAHGYPTHRARLGGKTSPQWVWISPNTVPRGFVRPDDPRYAELKDRLPGEADQYPGLPAESYLLSATDRVRSRVVGACVQSGLTIRPLREYLGDT
jgi:hypothetical protein